MKTRIRRLEMEISKKQKIINNLNMLLSKQQVDNKLIANLKTDLEAARQHTRKYKFKQVMTTEVRFPCTVTMTFSAVLSDAQICGHNCKPNRLLSPVHITILCMPQMHVNVVPYNITLITRIVSS